MTRGQNALVMGDNQSQDAAGNNIKIDLSVFPLSIVMPEVEEMLAHEQLLADIDKASSGKTLWRTIAV